MFFEKWNDFCRSMVKTHIQVAQKNIRDIRSIIYSSLSDKNLGRALAFSPERIENLKQLGYADAVRVIAEANTDALPAVAD